MSKWEQILEDVVIGKLVSTLIDEGFRIEISNQDGGGLFIYGVPDNGEKPETGFDYWAHLVPGNGPDIIVDYSLNLDTMMKPVNEFTSQFID